MFKVVLSMSVKVTGLRNSILGGNVSSFNKRGGVLPTHERWAKSRMKGSELLQQLNVTSGNT